MIQPFKIYVVNYNSSLSPSEMFGVSLDQGKEMKEMGESFFLALNVCETIAVLPCMPGKALQVLVDQK